jgi:alanine racemase
LWHSRPLWAEVDCDAIRHNVRALRAHAGGRTEIMAVVKANAYGHGAVEVARAALSGGAAWLAVVSVDEAAALRQAGVSAPILVLSYIDPRDAARVVRCDLTPTVTTKQLALALARASQAERFPHQGPLPVHVKVDTGLNRFGVTLAEAPAFIRFVAALPGLTVTGLCTHFASADEPDKAFTHLQVERFRDVAAQFPEIRLRHAANSAGLIELPELGFELARVGIALYGIYPSPAVSRSVALRPVLSLKACVARLLELTPGESVSYGRTWTASRPTVAALIPCGYGDGWSRALSNRGAVLIRGQTAPILGRVCMDHFVVEVTDIPGAAAGDEAVLIGEQSAARQSADDVAALLGTIPYEVVTALANRVPRVYLEGGHATLVRTLNGTIVPRD